MPITAQRSYDITPGSDLEDNAGFVPLSVLVDNYSPYWLLLPDAGRYVPPYTSGTVLPLIHADINRAQWIDPPLSGLSSQAYISTAGFAHLTYVAETLAYVAGSSVPNSVLSQQQAYSVAEGGTLNATLTFLAQGVRVDNPGGTCYTINGTNLIIPPWTVSWLANFTTPFNSITLSPIANPNGTPNTTLGGPLVVTLYAQQVTSSGGTLFTPTTVTPGYKFGYKTTGGGPSTSPLNFSLPSPASAKDIIVVIWAWKNGGSNTLSGPAITGFTQLAYATAANGPGYWIGYKIASGGEQNLSITFTPGSGATGYVLQAGVYGTFSAGIAQTGATSASNSASVTPVTTPNLLICADVYAASASAPTGPTSVNLLIDDSEVNSSMGGGYVGATALGHLYYTTLASETGTITWSATATYTVVIAGE